MFGFLLKIFYIKIYMNYLNYLFIITIKYKQYLIKYSHRRNFLIFKPIFMK